MKMNINLIRTITLIFLLGGIGSVTAQVLDSPVATVRLTETAVITQRQLRQDVNLFEQQLRQSLTTEQRREVLDAKINDLLLKQGARRAGISVSNAELSSTIAQQRAQIGVQISDAQFRELILQQTGLSYEEFEAEIRDTLLQQKFLAESKQHIFSELSEPTEAEIRKVYEENETSFINPSMRGFTHIFFDARGKSDSERQEISSQAEALSRQIRSGERNFQQAVNFAMDASNIHAGDFGYIQRGDQQAVSLLGQNFIDTVFAMAENQISRVIQSNLGYHIVKVTDVRSPRLLGLDDPIFPGQSMTVRSNIVQYILQEKQQVLLERALEELITELRDEAEITVFSDNLSW